MIILIADDDKLIRFTMKSMLHDILSDDSNYLEASDGQELIGLVEKHQPDIAFVDIKMPYLDGITAIEQCRKVSSRTEYVIISGYSDFESAKRCIPLQITEYLVKPVEEEQLQRIVSLLQEKLSHAKRRSNSDFRLTLLNTFNYLSAIGDSPEFEEPELSAGECFYMFGIYTDMKKNRQNEEAESAKKLLRSFDEYGQSLVNEGCHYGLIYSDEGTPCCIFQVPDTSSMKNRLSDMIKRINLSSRDVSINRSILTFHRTSLRALFNAVETYDSCSYLCMNEANNSILPVASLVHTDPEREVLRLLNQLLLAFYYADETAYKETINTLYRLYKDCSLRLNLLHLSQYIERVTGTFISHSSYKEFCRGLIDMSQQMYSQLEHTDRNLMDKIKQYIQKNYMNDLSISQIAEQYNLTPNYLSSLFHQQENCKLIDYITEVRLNHAKRILLKNTTASVKDVAVMVGYNSARHFSTIFQKATGVTPSTYRKGGV